MSTTNLINSSVGLSVSNSDSDLVRNQLPSQRERKQKNQFKYQYIEKYKQIDQNNTKEDYKLTRDSLYARGCKITASHNNLLKQRGKETECRSKDDHLHGESLQALSMKNKNKGGFVPHRGKHSDQTQKEINQSKLESTTYNIDQNASFTSEKKFEANFAPRKIKKLASLCTDKLLSFHDDSGKSQFSSNNNNTSKFCFLTKQGENKLSDNGKEIKVQKVFRQKKTVFKVPQFLKNKPQKIDTPQPDILKKFRSIPKNFRTTEQICHMQDESIHRFNIEKQQRQKKHPRKQCLSNEKNTRGGNQTQKKFKNTLKEKFMNMNMNRKKSKIQEEEEDMFQVGKQVVLKKIDLEDSQTQVSLKIIKILAESQNSSTYLVVQRYSGYLFCLKQSQVNLYKDAANTKQQQYYLNHIDFLIRQSKIGMFCDHPFLIKTYCTLYDAKHLYQLMQFVQGSTLQNHNKACKKSTASPSFPSLASGSLCALPIHSLTHIKQIISQLLEATMQLHSHSITHRDLKPANIFISNNHAFKIGDFGCSIYGPSQDFVGTLDYVAPQVILHQDNGMGVDLWAIGCMAYELWVGIPPFFVDSRAKTIERIIAVDWDAGRIGNAVLRDFVQKILKRDPKERMTAKQAYAHPFIHEYKQQKMKLIK